MEWLRHAISKAEKKKENGMLTLLTKPEKTDRLLHSSKGNRRDSLCSPRKCLACQHFALGCGFPVSESL